MDPLQSGEMSQQDALEAAIKAQLTQDLAGQIGPFAMG
jgi:hypothetical protein